jgi:oligoribonuclease (3'-5' exoribonuclease)
LEACSWSTPDLSSLSSGTFTVLQGNRIGDDNGAINIEIEAVANYYFDRHINVETLDKLFYVNSPALFLKWYCFYEDIRATPL